MFIMGVLKTGENNKLTTLRTNNFVSLHVMVKFCILANNDIFNTIN